MKCLLICITAERHTNLMNGVTFVSGLKHYLIANLLPGVLTMHVITLPNNEKFIIGSDRDIENVVVVVDFCGEEFATELMDYINDLKDRADYETLKFNSDVGVYEAENETFRTVLQDIESLLQQYEYGLERYKEPFSRKRVFKLFEEMHRLIGEVI